jgi:Lon protease-like protein
VITTPLPLFPLRLVLLPGAVVPLHIFEPRYRAMIRDVTEGTRCFGLISPPPDTAEADLPAGRVGCIAHVTAVDTLPDGRSNIMIEGQERFRFETWVEAGTPYRVGHVAAFDDAPDDAVALALAAARVRDLAQRALRASMVIHDVTTDPPTFDADDAGLSFQVAHMLRLADSALYALLADRSALGRLARLETALRAGLGDMEGSAELHTRAKTNGHHHGPPPG